LSDLPWLFERLKAIVKTQDKPLLQKKGYPLYKKRGWV